MKNKYITIRRSKYLVRDDLESFILFYNYFLNRSNRHPRVLYEIINTLNTLLIKAFFRLRLNIFLRKIELEKNFLVQRRSNGKHPSVVRLVKKDKSYLIQKYNNPKILNREKEFYDMYYKNKSPIQLPSMTIKDNYIELPFIKQKTLSTLIRESYYTWPELISIIDNLTKGLDILYGDSNRCLIHGDLTPDNVYYMDGIFTIIDYSDSEYYESGFDKFLFVKRVLSDYEIKDMNLEKYFSNKEIVRFQKHLEGKINDKFE